jgi:hypothetical protein
VVSGVPWCAEVCSVVVAALLGAGSRSCAVCPRWPRHPRTPACTVIALPCTTHTPRPHTHTHTCSPPIVMLGSPGVDLTTCAGPCTGHGQCSLQPATQQLTCNCDAGFTGPACALCAPGYSGPNCEPSLVGPSPNAYTQSSRTHA